MPRDWRSPDRDGDQDHQDWPAKYGKHGISNLTFLPELDKGSSSPSSSGSTSSSETYATSARCSGNFRKTENNSNSYLKSLKMASGAIADKTDIAAKINAEELYRLVSSFEEEDANNMNEEFCLEAYLHCCEELEMLMTEMYSSRRNDQTRKEIQALSKSKDYLEISEDCTVVMADIRRHSRYFKLKIKTLKDDLVLQRQIDDRNQLILRRVLFAANELSNQIPGVNSDTYKSGDGEIDLIHVQDFFKEAPASLVQAAENSPEKLWLARLEYEYMQRKQLTDKCDELEKVERKLVEEINAHQGKVDQAEPLLSSMLEATLEPALEFFDSDLPAQCQLCEGSEYLPGPLYRLYVFSVAFLQSHGNQDLKVKVHGDIPAAKELFQNQIPQHEIQQDSDSDSEDSDGDGVVDNQELRKALQLERKQAEKKKLAEINPLSVQWILTTEGGERMTVQFQYMTKLKIVCVKCSLEIGLQLAKKREALNEKAQKLLVNLYANDSGFNSPNPSTYFHLQKAGIGSFPELVKHIGRPYKWAQKLCGLEFPVMLMDSEDDGALTVKSMIKSCNATIEDTLERMLKRLKYQASRWSQLKQLRKNSKRMIPV